MKLFWVHSVATITPILPAELRFKSAIPEVYFQMLSTPGQTTSADKWKEAAVKFGAAQSVVHPQARYDELSYRERALILKVRDAALYAH